MKILITSGPTREPIDAVRYISNRSSGKLGIALARAAAAAGHETTLLLGPGPATPELGSAVTVRRFETVSDLQRLLEAHWPGHQVLIMAAAVADYRVADVFDGKLRRTEGGALTLTLEPTPDLVAQMSRGKRPDQRIVAFSLEDPAVLEERAAVKMRRKQVDAIVANPLQTADSERINAVWLTRDGITERPGAMSKDDFAVWLLEAICRFFSL